MEKMTHMKKMEYNTPSKKTMSLIATFMLVAALLVACGDDESFAVRSDGQSSESSEPDDPMSEQDEKSSSSSEKVSSSSVSSSSLAKSSSSSVSSSEPAEPDQKSSSSSAKSSSSEVKSSSSARSSSSSEITPCKTGEADNCVYGTLVDERDGQTYKTVTIGSQTWMAENLNYAARYSTCYKNDAANCSKYGRYYTWDIAIDSASVRNLIGKTCGNGHICEFKDPIRGVCPAGWHLPSKSEWVVLFYSGVGGARVEGSMTTAGMYLKATSGWDWSAALEDDGNGYDYFGFAALPAGYKTADFFGEGKYAFFWTSTDERSAEATAIRLNQGSTTFTSSMTKYEGASVRCVMDDPDTPALAGSVAEPTSSETVLPPCNVETDDSCFVDARDGQTYRMVYIARRIWMAQNLNYKTPKSYCYKDDSTNCAKYGRLYTWSAAVDSVGTWSDAGKGCGNSVRKSPNNPARGVCPEGWHLPSHEDWNALIAADSTTTKLKSTTGWAGGGNSVVVNGFLALPAGYGESSGLYTGLGYKTYFWSTREDFTDRAEGMALYAGESEADHETLYKARAFSVRCILD